MVNWQAGLGIALGALAGALLPIEAGGGSRPGDDVFPSRGEARAPRQAPSLVGLARPRAPEVAATGSKRQAAPREVERRVVEPSLPSPEREWQPILADHDLDPTKRAARLLLLAEEFSMRRHAEHAARTLDLIDDRLARDDPMRATVRLARAWNEHRRGDAEGATALAEAVSKDATATASVRARGAYACLLFAFGLGQTARAREALGLLAEHATQGEQSMLQDARQRFEGLLQPDEEG